VCKRLPGLRCVTHTRQRLAADQTWRNAQAAERDTLLARNALTTTQQDRVDWLNDSIARLDDQIRYDLADLNAANSERWWLATRLTEQVADAGPAAVETRKTALNLLEGKLQRAERGRQVALMPTRPAAGDDPTATTLWNQLARRRSKMACARTQMALSAADLDTWKHHRDVHEALAADALQIHARYTAVLAGGPSWWAGATVEAREEVVDAAGREADFTTPEEPAPVAETVAETIAQRCVPLRGGVSVDPAVDTVSWARWREEPSPLAAPQGAAVGGPAGVSVLQGSGGEHPPVEDAGGELGLILNSAEQRADTLLTAMQTSGPRSEELREAAAEKLHDNADPAGWLLLQRIIAGTKGPPTS
jgi:hypothetical protein